MHHNATVITADKGGYIFITHYERKINEDITSTNSKN
jgi:hypothetical protein